MVLLCRRHQLFQLGRRRFFPIHFDTELDEVEFIGKISQSWMIDDKSTVGQRIEQPLDHGFRLIDLRQQIVVIFPVILRILLIQLDKSV